MALSVTDIYSRPQRCACQCHADLSTAERAEGIAAAYRFDDFMRALGYQPIYEMGASELFAEAQRQAGDDYRGIAVRDHSCLYRRLIGFTTHELIHALLGDPSRPNYGIPFGAPYGVPAGTPPEAERALLDRTNWDEARAWVGIPILGRALYGIEWQLLPARDVGTYGFAGGHTTIDVPAGFRPVAHINRAVSQTRYYARARRLELDALAWFTDENVAELVARARDIEARGLALRPRAYPDPAKLAALSPVAPDRNDPCLCGSRKKWKACCGLERAA